MRFFAPQGPNTLGRCPMDTCYIVCAADMSAGRFSPREGDLVIAADAGCRHLQRLGVSPHLIVGDFDSLGLSLIHISTISPGGIT